MNPVVAGDEIKSCPDLVGRWVRYEEGEGPPAGLDTNDDDIFVVLSAMPTAGVHELLLGDLSELPSEPCLRRGLIALTPVDTGYVGHFTQELPECEDDSSVLPLFLPLRISISEDRQTLRMWVISDEAMRWAAGFNDPEVDTPLDALFRGQTQSGNRVATTLEKTPIPCVVVDGKLLISAQSAELRQFLTSRANPYMIGPELFHRLPAESSGP